MLRHLRTTRANALEYSQLEQRRAGIQVAFAAMFISISLTFLLAAIWAGLWFADRLVAPIRQLIDAAYEGVARQSRCCGAAGQQERR